MSELLTILCVYTRGVCADKYEVPMSTHVLHTGDRNMMLKALPRFIHYIHTDNM